MEVVGEDAGKRMGGRGIGQFLLDCMIDCQLWVWQMVNALPGEFSGTKDWVDLSSGLKNIYARDVI